MTMFKVEVVYDNDSKNREKFLFEAEDDVAARAFMDHVELMVQIYGQRIITFDRCSFAAVGEKSLYEKQEEYDRTKAA